MEAMIIKNNVFNVFVLLCLLIYDGNIEIEQFESICEVVFHYERGYRSIAYVDNEKHKRMIKISFREYFYYDYVQILSGDSVVFTGVISDIYAWSVYPYIYEHISDSWLSGSKSVYIKHNILETLSIKIGECEFEIKDSFSGEYEIWKNVYCEFRGGKRVKKQIIEVYDHATIWE